MSLQFKFAETAPALQPLSLVEEISHRVINEYTEAICLLTKAAASPANTETRATLISVANRLHAQAEAHRALQSPAVDGLIDLAGHLSRVCGCLSKSPLLDNDVWLTVETEEIWLDAEQCWRVGLIVAELVRNAARHGLAGGPGAVRVVITQNMGRVMCSVFDTGRRPAEIRLGRGQRLIQALAAELGGSVAWRFASAGCGARLEFPAVSPAEPMADGWLRPGVEA